MHTAPRQASPSELQTQCNKYGPTLQQLSSLRPSLLAMKFQRSNVSTRQEEFLYLPYTLQEDIIIQFMRDPYTTFDQLKALRLVSKVFNEIIAPKVLLSLVMFGYIPGRKPRHGREIVDNLRQHLALSSSRQHSDLRATVKLTIDGWEWSYYHPFPSYKSVPHIGQLIKQDVLFALVYCFKFLLKPQILPISIYCSVLRLSGRVCLSQTSRLNLPNIRCVVWTIHREDPKWVLSHTVKLLLRCPMLDELTLIIDQELEEHDYFIKRICKIHQLRKLKIMLRLSTRHFRETRGEHDIDSKLGKIIAANPNLTHLVLRHWGRRPYSLFDILRYVDPPLKLEHLCISSSFQGSSAIVPHIRSLTSCDFSDARFLAVLLAEEVFPPIMNITDVDDQTIAYLIRHPRITSLSLSLHDHRIRPEKFTTIFEILVRHANTFTHFEIDAQCLIDSLDNERNELLLLQCTNLEQLTIHHDILTWLNHRFARAYGAKMLSIVSRLGDSLTLVINDNTPDFFQECLDYCRLNPSLRSLARRMVYNTTYSEMGWKRNLGSASRVYRAR